VEADGGGDGGLLGADGEAVGGVFYVAAGDDGVGFVVEQERGAYAEVAVGGVGVVGYFGGALLESGDLGLGERAAGRVGGRHVSEATGCRWVMASRAGLMINVLCPIRGMWTI
jgi:hypothetical protein